MPLYEYECDACGRRFEVIQKYSDAPVEVCRECGKGPVRRLLSSPAIQFKGSGWYITDYAKKGTTDATTPAAKTDTAKTESKETKTETKTESRATDSKSKE
ncbi:MAG: transcriptional regulator [Acidobacteria bacterium]|nr:MAG: transcriptional regulator [Acidobacteriota bacterium]